MWMTRPPGSTDPNASLPLEAPSSLYRASRPIRHPWNDAELVGARREPDPYRYSLRAAGTFGRYHDRVRNRDPVDAQPDPLVGLAGFLGQEDRFRRQHVLQGGELGRGRLLIGSSRIG